MMQTTWAVILAGGRGTRFWPRSRRDLPKQCLALDGARTLVQQTVDRLGDLVPPERVLVVTGPDMQAVVADQLPELPPDNVLVEPRGRNTAPCIAWALAVVQARGGDAMVVLPSDHRIEDPERFREVLRGAVAAARDTGALVTLGQTPTRAETGYGYLQLGEQVGAWEHQRVLRVGRFVEKPDAATAQRYLDGGNHLWNGGMFVWTTEALDQALQAHLPRTAAGVARLRAGTPVEEVWGELDATSIDYGVLERHDAVLTVPCEFGWSDLGSWQAMTQVLPATPWGWGRVDDAVVHDADNCVVDVPQRLVALLGVEGLVVVDTGDVLLVADLERSQEVPKLLEVLRRRGLDTYL